MGIRGATQTRSEQMRDRACLMVGCNPLNIAGNSCWPSDEEAEERNRFFAGKEAEVSKAIRLMQEAEDLKAQAEQAQQNWEEFSAAHFSPVRKSDDFPSEWQRKKYAGKFAVFIREGAFAFADTPDDARKRAIACLSK